MAKIYIAGKVSGLPYAECSMKFGKYQKQLMDEGHEPVVPLDLCNRNDTWPVAMGKCIAALLTCQEIHLLPCWRDSPGARVEVAVATERLIPIKYV